MPNQNKCIGRLFQARDIAHLFHLQTTSFAAHIASEEFYKGILKLTDKLAESYQGKNGLLDITIEASYNELAKDLVSYLDILLKYLETETVFTDSDELNIIDEIKTLIKQTLYKLKFLK